jgi:hypothetical protein
MPVIAEALAAEIRLGELQVLDLGPHRAVEHENAFAGGIAKSLGSVVGRVIEHRYPPSFRSGCLPNRNPQVQPWVKSL